MPVFRKNITIFMLFLKKMVYCRYIISEELSIMERKEKKYQAYIQILKEELVPATGCTEPIALAYASAKAKEVLGVMPERIEIEASGSIIKNVKSVVVPNTNGLKGIPAAAAAGVVAGNANRKLEVIASVTPAQIQEINEFLAVTPIQVAHVDRAITFEIVVTLYAGDTYSRVRIANHHTNIVHIEKNGQVLFDIEVHDDAQEGLTDRTLLDMKSILDFANTVDIEDIRDIIGRQIQYNTAISEEGFQKDYGANIGSVLLKADGDSIRVRAKARAAAGSDARMNGCELPVIINSGSGNQGMTCSLPVIEFAKELNSSEEQLYRALVLSNLITIHQKTGIGRLSAYCGAVCAGAAAGAGIAYLHGENFEVISHTIINALAIDSGIICDGAKSSCAAKIASAVDAGILGYDMFKNGQQFYGGEGIVTEDVDDTIRNVGILGREGMKETNNKIIDIMIHNPL